MPARDPQTDSIPRPRALGLGIDMGPFVAPLMKWEKRGETKKSTEKVSTTRKLLVIGKLSSRQAINLLQRVATTTTVKTTSSYTNTTIHEGKGVKRSDKNKQIGN